MKINDNSVLLVNHCSLIFRHLGFWSLCCRPTVSLVVPSQAVDWCICFTWKIQQGGDWERTPPQLFSDCATSELSMPAWNWNVADSKKNYFRPDHGPYFPIWQSKKCPTILCAVNLWLKPVSYTGASLQCRIFKCLSLSNTVVFLVTLISHCLSRSNHHMYMIKI